MHERDLPPPIAAVNPIENIYPSQPFQRHYKNMIRVHTSATVTK